MSEHQQGAWGAQETMWWQGDSQQQQLYQQMTSANDTTHTQSHFSYKMANSFPNQNVLTTDSNSGSPVGRGGGGGYDYNRQGESNTPINVPSQAPAQWWYPPSTMENMIPSMPHAGMQHPVNSPPPTSDPQSRQDEVQRQQQEAHRQHQEAIQHHQQAIAEAQAKFQQLQQHAQQLQQAHQQLQQHNQLQNNHHQQQSVLQQHQQLSNQNYQPKSRMPRKGDGKPRGRMSAYAFFVQTCSEEHKKKHPDENVVFAEFSKKCAERWKTMVDKEKKRFQEMAEIDKKRYDSEMQNYTPPQGKKRKHTKDPNAPKRALSAFFWFSNEERGKVKAENPEYGVGDIAKELGRRWADADADAKGKYEQLASKDKARYDKEMTAYKNRNNPNLQKAAVPELDDDDGEDVEEEEDE